MCGIAGVVAWDEKYRATRDVLQRMSNAIAHRGPDGEGFFLNHEREITPDNPQVGFAFRRLAIIDPDPRSMQPFTIGHLTLVFNGEIYNYRELRSEISKLRPDYQWRTQGDVEVLLMSYDVWREKCVEHLNGMFAIAVWDEREKSLYLARDRMGQKPLYVVQSAKWNAVVFASEVAALRQIDWSAPPDLPFASLETYFRYGYVTWLAKPGQFSPGAYRVLKVGTSHRTSLDESCYWNARNAEPINDSRALEATRRLVESAVQRQLVSDVPIGLFLSGGMDSSVVTACARRDGPVQTFSIAFDDARYDESNYARQVARHLGTEHQEFRVTPDVIADLPRLVATFGEPFADSSMLPTYYLARETRRHVKVALSGDGGDELFGGYDRYYAMRLSDRITRRKGYHWPASRLTGSIARVWSAGHPKSKITRAARFLSTLSMDPPHRYDAYVRIFDDRTIEELLGRPTTKVQGVGDPRGELHWLQHVVSAFNGEFTWTRDVVRAALAADRLMYLPNDLLTKVDRCSMLHNLEVRSPFMDHELVQFAAGLTTDQLLKGGPKRMLREAFARDLPDFVFKRPKMGFAVPIGEWFRGPLRGMLRDNLFSSDSFGRQHFNMKVVERLVEEHEAERVDHSQRLYALLMLELWWRWYRSL